MTEQTMAARLATIMGEVGRIEKKGKIKSFGSGPSYNFARDTDVLEAVTPKMAEAGIVMVPERVELLSTSLTMSEKQYVSNIKTAWHVTDGRESLRFETFGQGADTGDKALPKAQSNARKYAFFMLYHIVTGDDPDHWASDDQPERSERATATRRAVPEPATTSAPVQRTPEEQELLDQLFAMPGMTIARGELLADAVGVPKGQHANAEQLRAMIARADTPAPDVGQSSATDPGSQGDSPPVASEPGPAPSMDDVLAVTGGEVIPPKPGTSEYRALPSGMARSQAKAYWDAQKAAEGEQESLSAVLGGPGESDR